MCNNKLLTISCYITAEGKQNKNKQLNTMQGRTNNIVILTIQAPLQSSVLLTLVMLNLLSEIK
jgi:hypothetical protein